jgi:DNA polymerase-3 subunit delta'
MRTSLRTGFDSIIGQEMAKRVLSRAVREGSPTHAYLFLGPEGSGKATTAVEFAKALNCENPQDGNACGECALCRSIEHGNLPEVRIWSPDRKKQKQDTTIDQMREMREFAMLRPVRSRWKVNIVEEGDTLNEESSNCILKLLEEPPGYLVNILIFRNASNALPTIRSRCQLVRFTPVSTAELVDRLLEDRGATNDQARFLGTYSQGCPGRAIRLMEDPTFFERRDAVADVAGQAATGNPWSALKLAEALRTGAGGSKAGSEPDSMEESDEPEPEDQPKRPKRAGRDTVLQSLDMLLLWYRDLLATRLQGPNAAVVNVDRLDEISAQSVAYPHAGRLLGAIEAILEAKRIILGNGNPQIATEALMIRILGN